MTPPTITDDTKQETAVEIGLYDTYYAALQHDLVNLPSNTRLIGVVNHQMHGFSTAVDDNYPSLGPPEALFNDFRTVSERHDNLTDVEAHNRAWVDVDYADRYRRYLTTGWELETATRDACETILSELENRPVALVCYESDEKHCHRRLLRDFLTEQNNTTTHA